MTKLNGGKLYESDILKILLSNAYGGRDMSKVADNLLARFPSVRSIIGADLMELTAVEGVTETIALYLKSLGMAVEICRKKDEYIRSTKECMEFAFERFNGKDNESAEIYFVNKSGKVTKIKSFTSGNANSVDISSGELMALLSSSDAYGMYFVHNHVNASATPSANDIFVTSRLIAACDICKLQFFDHCIVSSTGDKFSFRESGTFDGLKGGK